MFALLGFGEDFLGAKSTFPMAGADEGCSGG
jgi:hypothetical protein